MIKFLIKLCFGEAIRKRNQARKHNAAVLQDLLDKEHSICDSYNRINNTVFATAKALDKAYCECLTDYNRHSSLLYADFWAEV